MILPRRSACLSRRSAYLCIIFGWLYKDRLTCEAAWQGTCGERISRGALLVRRVDGGEEIKYEPSFPTSHATLPLL